MAHGSLMAIKKPENCFSGFDFSAVWTGLEPATSGVTGRHSNQLNYQTLILLVAMGLLFRELA